MTAVEYVDTGKAVLSIQELQCMWSERIRNLYNYYYNCISVQLLHEASNVCKLIFIWEDLTKRKEEKASKSTT